LRNISFSLTTEQVRRHEKTVTRRLGWWNLKPGTVLQAVEKAQGLKKGEHVKPICLIRVVSVQYEGLYQIGNFEMHEGRSAQDEVNLEGFPDLTPSQFLDMFCKANNCTGFTGVNRIEFEYLDFYVDDMGNQYLAVAP
jgi:hypothetical protein